MSCLEVAYQAAKDVRAVVCSEELEPGDGWPYDEILADLRSNPTMDGAGAGPRRGQALCRVLQGLRGQWPVTMCAVHRAGIEPFADTVDAFTMALRRAIKDDDVTRRGCCGRTRAAPASTAT